MLERVAPSGGSRGKPISLLLPASKGHLHSLACGLFDARDFITLTSELGNPGGSDGKMSTCNVGDLGSVPGLGRSPGGGHGNPAQYSCLENPMDRGAWQAAVHRVAQSWTQLKRLSMGSNSRVSQAWRIVVVPELLQILQCTLSECAQS